MSVPSSSPLVKHAAGLLRQLRGSKSTSAAAELLGIIRNTVSGSEQGRNMTLERLEAYGASYGVRWVLTPVDAQTGEVVTGEAPAWTQAEGLRARERESASA